VAGDWSKGSAKKKNLILDLSKLNRNTKFR